jgi:uncharacterized membrane protein
MIFALLVNACALLFVVRARVHLVRQRRKRRERPRDLVVSTLAGMVMSAMLLGLQEIVKPQVRHMIVEEMKQESVDDEDGEPIGGKLFHEQMRRIRSGEEVEEITVPMDAEPSSRRIAGTPTARRNRHE